MLTNGQTGTQDRSASILRGIGHGAQKRVLLATSAAPTQSPFFTREKRPPIGVGFLISVLRQAGHKVFFIDNYLQPSNFLDTDYLQTNRIDHVGIYANTICFRDTLRMLHKLEQLRQQGKWQGKIMVGGPHVSVAPHTIPDFVNHIVKGEGEQAILDIVDGKVTDRVVSYPRIENLDVLPMPAWDYFVGLPYNWGLDFFDDKPVFTMNTSRGCPFRCAFCSVGSIWGRRYICFSAERIVADIEYLIKNYGAKGIYFREDNFTFDEKRLRKFCNLLIDKGINIPWVCESRVSNLNRDIVELMARAGAKGFYFGVESGSQRMLDLMNKGITVEQIENAFRWCHEFDIRTAASVVVGVPGETQFDLEQTNKLLKKINPTVTWTNVFVGIPDSNLYRSVLNDRLYQYIDDRGLVYLQGHNDRVRHYYRANCNVYIPDSEDRKDWTIRPKVSVLMCVHNCEKFVRQALQSVYSQTYQDFEVVVVDDGSTDSTPDILLEMKDSRTVIYRNAENKGLTKSLNSGLKLCRGEYIARMDADDISHRQRFEKQVKFLDETPSCIAVGCWCGRIDSNGKLWGYWKPPTEHEGIKKHLVVGSSIPHGSAMVRRSVLIEAGGYDERYEYSQDYDLWLRLCEVGELRNIGEFLYMLRSWPGAITKTRKDQQDKYADLARQEATRRKNAEKPEMIPETSSPENIEGKKLLRLAAETVGQRPERNEERYGFNFRQCADKTREKLEGENPDRCRFGVSTVLSGYNRRLKIAILPHRNNISFMGEILARIRASHDVRIVDCNDQEQISMALTSADVCWIEWATDFAVRVTRLPRRCKTILRMHSFEAFRSFPQQINWENVDDLIFVSPYIREVLKNQVPDIDTRVRTHVVPNCVDLDKFYFKDRPHSKKIAFVGDLRPTKNIPFLMECFQEIHSAGPEFTLHVAGELFGDELHRNELDYYIKHIEREHQINGSVFFYGHVQNVSSWLDDKDFILSTSIREGHAVNIIEGMAKGLKPVIHNFPGAGYFYPKKWMFRTAQECRDIVLSSDFDRHAYVTYVKDRWSTEKVLPQIDALLESLCPSRLENQMTAGVQTETVLSHAEMPKPARDPKVSIITTCHNCEKYIPECVESVRSQTMQQWELFLLDDGSTDGTRRIIEDHSRIDKRIIPLYFDDNKGPYVRRNSAIKQVASDFIVIQDADDIMCPGKLETLYNEITKDERLGIVGSFYHKFFEEFEGLEYSERCELGVLSHEEIMQSFRSRWDFCWHGSAIIRKTMFDAVGLYDENPFGSDSFWLAKAGEYAYHSGSMRFKNIPDCLTLRRIHADSQTGVLPTFDPRSRRVKFVAYCENKIRKIRDGIHNNPGTDIAAELRRCECSDFTVRYGHLFHQWENAPLEKNTLTGLVNKAVASFNNRRYVTCISILNGLEVGDHEIAERLKNYDLLRAMAYFAVNRKQESRGFLERELQSHRNAAAEKFLCDCFEKRSVNDVQTWCRENNRFYNLQIIDTERMPVRSFCANRTLLL